MQQFKKNKKLLSLHFLSDELSAINQIKFMKCQVIHNVYCRYSIVGYAAVEMQFSTLTDLFTGGILTGLSRKSTGITIMLTMALFH